MVKEDDHLPELVRAFLLTFDSEADWYEEIGHPVSVLEAVAKLRAALEGRK